MNQTVAVTGATGFIGKYIIDNLLAKEQQAHSVVQNALAKIDLIKKSILARAFRGQLATNNPADEPAVKLLERVL